MRGFSHAAKSECGGQSAVRVGSERKTTEVLILMFFDE